MNSQNVLDIKNLTKNYGNFVALENISFSIEQGTILGLLGKNGSGKTTLMKTIIGLLCRYDGTILFQGKPIEHENYQVMRKISSLIDVRFYEDMTAYENLNYLLLANGNLTQKKRKEKILALLDMVGLKKNKDDKAKSFSFGMKQRLALAQVFLRDAELLILDEPFVGLDPTGMEEMRTLLRRMQKEKGVSIIFSSHQLDEVGALADKVVAIDAGKIKYEGTLEELQEKDKKYYIWYKGKENATVIPYQTEGLQKVLRQSVEEKMEIEKIEVSENALYNLFV